MAQDDTATELGSLRAGVANSEIGVDSLRASTGEIRQQIERIEVARDATVSIAGSHKHQGRKKWVARALRREWKRSGRTGAPRLGKARGRQVRRPHFLLRSSI
jgi:hypothetical protein